MQSTLHVVITRVRMAANAWLLITETIDANVLMILEECIAKVKN